jgi:hypothetical protein
MNLKGRVAKLERATPTFGQKPGAVIYMGEGEDEQEKKPSIAWRMTVKKKIVIGGL